MFGVFLGDSDDLPERDDPWRIPHHFGIAKNIALDNHEYVSGRLFGRQINRPRPVKRLIGRNPDANFHFGNHHFVKGFNPIEIDIPNPIIRFVRNQNRYTLKQSHHLLNGQHPSAYADGSGKGCA
ncbi:hypothetical protein [Geobacillus sp. C56-T3]|uniref:hypothetical protein n=1 Tax=Geobacillus sp. (strain C56-T3) TaxID=691437 RepID=UPI001877BAF0|nr:hypothetical protein [Geobacillus sp. C56-T3]